MKSNKISKVLLSGMLTFSLVPGVVTPLLAEDGTNTPAAEKTNTIAVHVRVLHEDGTFWYNDVIDMPADTSGKYNDPEIQKLFNLPIGYELTGPTGDFSPYGWDINNPIVITAKKVDEVEEPEKTTVTMNIRFMCNGEFIAGGDYSIPAGTQNYSVLEQYVPKGYKMTVSGDFSAIEGGKLEVNVEKINKDVIMNVVFMDGETPVGGGDYFLPEGVQNYSVLEQYVPEGYQMTESGDFFVEEGKKLEVKVEKIVKDVIMNIQFKNGDEVVGGGDYFLPEGVQNYSVLEQYLPEGYKLAVSGDFMVTEGGHEEVRVEKIVKEVIMNIRFVDADGNFVAGGDYFLPEGVQNRTVLEKYVPESYKMTVTGDIMITEGGSETVTVEKIDKEVVMNILFKDVETGEVVAGGDYFVKEGVQNYTNLGKYVPEGYEMTVSGDFMGEDGGKLVVNVKKSVETVIMNIVFVDVNGVVAGGGDYFLPAGVNNYSILEEYVPEGYEMTVAGDFYAENGGHEVVTVANVGNYSNMHINWVLADGTKVAEGDYQILEGINNYSVLDQYVPEGYAICVSGDFYATDDGTLDVRVESTVKDVIMNVRFVNDSNGSVVAGGDYFLPEGVQNLSILEQYVPEGYKMCETGDFMVTDGGSVDIRVSWTEENIKMHLVFKDAASGEVVSEGDYELKDGIQNYSTIAQYVPEGYEMTVSGDFFANNGYSLVVSVKKIETTPDEEKAAATLVVWYVDENGDLVSEKTYTSAEGTVGETYTFVVGEDFNIEIPEGYKLKAEAVDSWTVNYGETQTLKIEVVKDTAGTTDNKPAEEEKADEDKVDTGVRNSVAGFASVAAFSGAAALAIILKKKLNASK